MSKAINTIDTVMSRMLEPVGLGEQQLNRTLGDIMKGGIDYADLYFQVSRQESRARRQSRSRRAR